MVGEALAAATSAQQPVRIVPGAQIAREHAGRRRRPPSPQPPAGAKAKYCQCRSNFPQKRRLKIPHFVTV